MALTAHGEAMIRSLNMLAARYAIMAAKREIEFSTKSLAPPGQSEVQRLRALAEEAASNVPDPVRALTDAIKMTFTSDADPYQTMGVLLEGAVYVCRTWLPPERQADAGAAIVQMLIDRLRDSEIPRISDH